MSLDVIGVGFGRSATRSMHAVLEQAGFRIQPREARALLQYADVTR
jgi:hypothetical protein